MDKYCIDQVLSFLYACEIRQNQGPDVKTKITTILFLQKDFVNKVTHAATKETVFCIYGEVKY